MCFPRIWRTACLLTLLAITLAGCDLLPATPEPVAPLPEPTGTPEQEVTEALPPGITPLVFWEPYALDRAQGILLLELVRDFEAENPDIQVEVVARSGFEGIHIGILDELAAPDGVLPDLAVAFPSMIAEYAASGAVLPLDRFINDPAWGLTDEDLADFFPGMLQAGRLAETGGQIMAFPFIENAVGMWVNRTLLDHAGWDHVPVTWAEFEQACWDVFYATGSGCYPTVESVSTFTAWLFSRGGHVLDETGRQATFYRPAGIEGLALLRRLMDAGLAWRPEDPYGDYVAFANGQAAFTFSSTGSSRLYLDAYEGALLHGVAPFRWEQNLIPQADPAQPATALYGAGFFILAGAPERELAAWRLIRWFTATQQTARWSGGLETMPVRLSALSVMTDTLEAYPFVLNQVTGILPYARPEPAVVDGFQVRDILHTAIVSVTHGLADPQAALDQAARGVDAVLSERP